MITGATSSLGLALIKECIEQDMEVLAIANRGSARISLIPEDRRITVWEMSLAKMSEAVVAPDEKGNWDAFFHLAWASTGGDVARNQLLPQALNIQYALDAVELASKLGCKVFVGAGSQAEYGRTEAVLTEELEPKPETAYGMAKLCAGQMTRLACGQKGMKHIWPRILSAYGPHCPERTVIYYTLKELLQGRKPILSAGEQVWDFVYVSDVARALMAVAEKGRDQETYLIGAGESGLLKDYLERARKTIIQMQKEGLLGAYNEQVIQPLGLGMRDYGDNPVMHLACSIEKLCQDTGYTPQVDFETGIRMTVQDLLQTKPKTDQRELTD